MTYEIATSDSAGTQAVATRLAKLMKGGEVIELVSDLGGGKTTFVQGLARGLGYSGEVTSPTFTLSQVYKLPGSLELHHYDFYRLGTSGVVGDELVEDVSTPGVITVVEWPGLVQSDLPRDHLSVKFEITGESTRHLQFVAGGPESARLVKGLAS